MKVELENIDLMLPTEEEAVNRTFTIEDDGEILQISFLGEDDDQNGLISLTKDNASILRDVLTTFLNNRLKD
ncbi:hypothetical protein [Brumimicrobium aurantiacum]|uniref:Uncharacterized protein n=1 Tax=Brumimicrobium aurantiacum TaxID=1737063 RepID=A0A3E1EZ79_9FLAO|nr:hypothetical protein [Brumimicrobium aurantiacum]RFC54879.1 hypothetical protein DXU93_03395 [Brumimicrobium aurantiacum]